MTKNVGIKTIDDLDSIPQILYKYRSWDNIYHKTILTEKQVYFAAPTSFEDPLDCKNKIRYDLLTDEDIFQKYLSDSQSINSNFSNSEHIKWAKKHFDKSPLRAPAKLKKMQEKKFEEYDERIGILSLTAEPRNSQMWEKYSNYHRGFCLGFNSKSLFKSLGGGGVVDYVKELPQIHPFYSYKEQHYLQVFKKLEKWEFEKEYRTHIFSSSTMSKEDRIVEVPASSYNCLIIGAKMPKKQKDDLMKSIPDELSHIRILEAEIIDGEVCIESL
ncbi:Protein of unknown function (DUF2971) [Fodinibius salinus]|uniref:DUF2971 domain-containing protein n=1 Tax=Fodinibius salinus TaxID=860790 RepID=A0A5D3YL12_9BACT|nr:DUF2971 domain-containing protein [Fodinibius salinus]TYP94876.1 Protein of unknown function (DUF2971) [Fodinibius salinus]